MVGLRIRHDLHRRRGAVAAVDDLSPRLRRVTIALDEGSAPVPHIPMAVGDHVKLAFPHPETGQLELDGPERPVLRDYTIRAVPEPGLVVIDFLLHGTGPGSSWASRAGVGSIVGVLGPRGSHMMPDDRPRYLVLADESAHPAAARWLEEAPVGAEVHVVFETEDGGTANLPERPGASVTIVAGTDGSGLVRVLTALSPEPGDLVWAAGEATAMVAVRRTAKSLGLGKDDVQVDGYWKRGVSGRDHHSPLED